MNGAEVLRRGDRCQWFRHHLGDFASGEMDPVDQQSAEDHLLGCTTCLELWAQWVGDAPDLTRGLFSRMGIDPCSRAAELLGADHADLSDLDNDLLSRHLGICPDCDAVAATIRRLASDLPELRDLTPDPRFLEDVIEATLPSFGAVSPWTRIRDFCGEVAQRPRIAIEVAYAVSLLALVFTGFDAQIFAGVQRAQQTPSVVSNTVADINSLINRRVKSVGEDFHGAVGGSLQTTSAAYQQALSRASKFDLRVPEIDELIGSYRSDRLRAQPGIPHKSTESNEDQGGSE